MADVRVEEGFERGEVSGHSGGFLNIKVVRKKAQMWLCEKLNNWRSCLAQLMEWSGD